MLTGDVSRVSWQHGCRDFLIPFPAARRGWSGPLGVPCAAGSAAACPQLHAPDWREETVGSPPCLRGEVQLSRRLGPGGPESLLYTF